MLKAKFCSFAIACMIGSIGAGPMTVYASETKTESVTLSERDKDQKDKRAALKESMETANEKWNTLTKEQKSEVYSLIEADMNAEFKLIDKFVELGVFKKSDGDAFKIHMNARFNKLKKTGEFPLSQPRGGKK